MKPLHIKRKAILLLTILIAIKAQSQSWQLGGNTDATPPPFGLLSNSNFFGATQTASVRMGTGGISRIFMSGTSSPNPGYIGIGNNFLTPQSVLNINAIGYTTGNVFRTDGPNAQANVWSMFTGTSTGTTEKGAIFTGGNLEGRK